MSKSRRCVVALAALAAASACFGPPRRDPQPIVPQPGPSQPVEPAPPQPPADDPATDARQRRRIVLPNGMAAYVEVAPGGSTAQVQLGVFAGTVFGQRGLAELAARVLLESSDAASGRNSLRREIADLGGTIETHIGLTSTWFELRLPIGQVPRALASLRRALERPTQSRKQIERMRNELVAERAGSVQRDPVGSMTRALLHAESGTDSYLDGLLDVDPSEVDLFLSRMYRPTRCFVAVSLPRELEQTIEMVQGADQDDLGGWSPAPAVPGETGPEDRKFQSGLYWAEAPQVKDRVRLAIVLLLPDATEMGAAEWLVMHSCLTLDGTGGRLERLQQDAGLDDVTWESRLVQTADKLAMELSATVDADQVPRLWEVFRSARRSLLEVPPNESERALANRRALLNARLAELDEGARLRLHANLFVRNVPTNSLQRRLRELADPSQWDAERAAAKFAETPAWMVAIGAPPTDKVQGVERFELLPPGFAPTDRAQVSQEAIRGALPWLRRARAALGGDAWFARLDGYRATAEITADGAPPSAETTTWHADGDLHRTRELLGAQVVTTLAGDRWTEQFGDQTVPLVRAEAEHLRRAAMRHPLVLLAENRQGRLDFRPIAERTFGDRQFMVLEAVGERFDRLRIHIDLQSHLVRTVESWERIDRNAPVHVREEWSDYRQVGALRVPHRRRTAQDDGRQQSETIFRSWTPLLPE